VPSQTELLHNLGLKEEVIAITKFCVHPDSWFRTKERIGGTKTVNLAKIKSLNPDLVIANKEENVKEQIEAIQQISPVYISDVNTLEDAIEMIEDLGQLLNRDKEALLLIQTIQSEFNKLTITGQQLLKTAYIIWRDPYMLAGGDTFISHMLSYAGFINVFKHKERYPTVTIQQIAGSSCDVLMLSSEPYPFKQDHLNELKVLLPHTKIILVDGEMFSWYGSRLQLAPAYFLKLQQQLISKKLH
jgi:ABC-type Fe3+-hydroxamate transport system substrate-binding protein